MSGVSEMVVAIAVAAMVLLGLIIAWWFVRSAVSVVARTVMMGIVSIALAIGGTAAYIGYLQFTGQPIPFPLSLIASSEPSE